MARRSTPEINASSMADIAFLLLIFFLMVTKVGGDEAMDLILPPKDDDRAEVKLKPRNVFLVQINSADKLLVEKKRFDLVDLRRETLLFLDNKGSLDYYSESPTAAVVALKADRGTSYKVFLEVLNELKAAYHELRAEEMGITTEVYLTLDLEASPELEKDYLRAKKKYPLNLSIAEPSSFGGNK